MSETEDTTERTPDKDLSGAIGSAFLGAVGLYVFVNSFGLSTMAAMFPRTIGAVLAILALVQIAAALTGRSARAVEAGSSVADQAEGLGRRLVLVATMIGWALLFPVIGMFVTSLTACVILMFTAQFGSLSHGRRAVYLGVALGMVTVFYLLMSQVLNIPMPRGLLF